MVVQSSDVPSRNPGFKFGLFAKGNMDVKTRRVEARYFWGGPKQKTIKHQGMVNCWFGARWFGFQLDPRKWRGLCLKGSRIESQTNTWPLTIKKTTTWISTPQNQHPKKSRLLRFCTQKKIVQYVASFRAPSEFEILHLCDKNDG